MLATQRSAREGRDDGAKMAARLRVLPLRGQENIQGANETETRRGGSWGFMTTLLSSLDDVAVV